MKLFDEMPRIEGERILMREMAETDAEALQAFAQSEAVYRYLPTFLFEQKYPDAHTVIERVRAECFDTHESLLLTICPTSSPETFMGLAEVYNYDPPQLKASLGCRLAEEYWGQDFATEATQLLIRYLTEHVGLKVLTAHVMVENTASAKVLLKSGFVMGTAGVWEDWGFEEPVFVDKYVYLA